MAMNGIVKCDRDGYENIFFKGFGTEGMDSATAGALRSDVIRQGRQLVKTYRHQPRMFDGLPKWLEPVGFDGMDQIEIPTFEDIDIPLYVIVPAEKHVSLGGTRIREPIPELVLTAKRRVDKWRQPFAGRARVPRLLSAMRAKIAEYRDIKNLQGDSTISPTIGVIPGATTLTVTGAWDVETNSDGVLSNANTDLLQVIDTFDGNGYNGRPIIIGLTSYAHSLLRTTIKSYTDTSNMELWLKMLPAGSRVLPSSNNLQASVTASANTMIAVVDTGEESSQGITLVESGLQQVARELGLFDFGYGQRKRTFCRVTDNEKVLDMGSIDTTT